MTATSTICARCGAAGPSSEAACRHCGAVADQRPVGPPASARCPVCGTAVVEGRRTCPGCGFVVPGPRATPEPAPVRRWEPWHLVAAGMGLVALTAVVVTLLGRDGPPALSERWRVELASPALAAPVVTGDTAVVVTADGTLVAADTRLGTPRWRFLTEQQPTAPVAADGELAVLATTGPAGSGLVFGVDLRTGQERWRVQTEEPVTDAPAIDADGAYLSRGDVSAHDLTTGEQRWRRPVEGGAGAVTVGAGTVVAVGGDGVVALSSDTGELRWSSGGGRPEVAPGVVGDLVVVADGPGTVLARSLERGQERWRADVGGELLQPVLAGPDVAVVVTTGGVVGLGVADGEERWEAGPAGDERVLAAAGDVAVGVRTGSGVLLVDGLSGAVLASDRRGTGAGDPPATPPAVTDDESLLLAEGDEVVALRPGG